MVNFKTIKISGTLVGLAWSATIFAANESTPTTEILLKDADRARGALESGLSWNTAVDTVDGKTVSKVEYVIKSKGDKAVAETTAPEAAKGEYLIFKERNLWYLKPGMKRAVVISARQKLTGPASNADIASTNYFRDYDGTIVGEEKVDGVDCWKLELKAKAKNVSYNGIRYWITKTDHLGIKADFLSVKGEVFKSARFKYDNKLKVDKKDQHFVSDMMIVDSQRPDSSTNIKVKQPKIIDIPDGALDLSNFKK